MDPSRDASGADPLEGLTGVRFRTLERVPIRTRESGVTVSAWRLSASAGQGDGSIFSIEASDGGVFWRGEGIFLGWPAERLARAYAKLLPRSEEPPLDLNQLG
jgi:hypothetical protein